MRSRIDGGERILSGVDVRGESLVGGLCLEGDVGPMPPAFSSSWNLATLRAP